MKKLVLLLTILMMSTFVFSQGRTSMPAFQGISYPAVFPDTVGKIKIFVAGLIPGDKPLLMTVTCSNQTVITKSNITADTVMILNVPIGSFHFSMKTATNLFAFGDSQIGTKMPDGKIMYNTLVIQYPNK